VSTVDVSVEPIVTSPVVVTDAAVLPLAFPASGPT